MMKQSFLNLLSLLTFFSISLILISCDDDDDPTEPQFELTGEYSIESAVFVNPVDLDPDGPGPAPVTTITDATPIITSGLLGASECAAGDDTYVEFATDGNYNLTCASGSPAPVDIGNWSFDEATNVITLTNLTVPNPADPDSTITLPFLQIVNITASIATNELNGTIDNLPYDAEGNTEDVNIVFLKQD